MSRKNTQKREKITLFGEKMARECQRSRKIHSYVKYETNSAAKRKAIWSQKFISTCKHLQNGRLRNNKWRVFHCYKQSSFTLKRVK